MGSLFDTLWLWTTHHFLNLMEELSYVGQNSSPWPPNQYIPVVFKLELSKNKFLAFDSRFVLHLINFTWHLI
jgi:hypothetical protein